jgi:hypothetical protein
MHTILGKEMTSEAWLLEQKNNLKWLTLNLFIWREKTLKRKLEKKVTNCKKYLQYEPIFILLT